VITQPYWTGKPDNITHPSGIKMENELQIQQPFDAERTNDLSQHSIRNQSTIIQGITGMFKFKGNDCSSETRHFKFPTSAALTDIQYVNWWKW
jgi:hypothetical protein